MTTINAMGATLASLQAIMADAIPETRDVLGTIIAAGTLTQDDGSLDVVDATGIVRFTATSGAGFGDMQLPEFLQEIRTARPELFKPTAAAVAEIAAQVRITEAKAETSLAARIRASTAAHAAAQTAKAAPASTINPFDPRTSNITAQMVLLNTNPALARRMKAALIPAGKH